MADQVKINDKELENVSGGAGNWQQYAKGGFVNYGNYIVYTVAAGDVLSGIAIRFGVTYQQIAQWNNIKNPDVIQIGHHLSGDYSLSLRKWIFPCRIKRQGNSFPLGMGTTNGHS